MEGYKRCYVQCRSGRLAGSLTHMVVSPCRKSSSRVKPKTPTNLTAVVNLRASDENVKEFMMRKACTVVIKNPAPVQEVFDDLPKLRKRKLQDYTELSMSPNVERKNQSHVPIYKQSGHEEAKAHVNSDLYEFDSDSEDVKKKKKRRRVCDKTADQSVAFEKGMKDVMRAIEKNFKRKEAHGRKKVRVAKTVKQRLPSEEVQNANWTKTVAHVTLDEIVLNHAPTTLNQSDNDFLGFDDASPAMQQHEVKDDETPRAETIRNDSGAMGNLFDEDTVNASDLFSFNGEFGALPLETTSTKPTVETNESESDLFGFGSESNASPERRESESATQRVNIISDVLISPPKHTDFDRPDANSTMVLIARRPKRSSSPWRPELGITRHPYLLQFKDTLLPNYNQEMVLDSTISDKSCVDVGKTPARPNEPPKAHQTSILEYFNGSKGIREEALAKECSLFDDSDFSPIKNARERVGKENLPPQKTSTAIKKIKRDILGQNAPPNRMPLSPLQNLTNRVSQEDLEDYFGFDSFTEDDKENAPAIRRKPPVVTKSYVGRPIRYEGVVVKRTAKNTVEVVEEIAKNNAEPERILPNEELRLKLFEDLEDEAPIRRYAPKRTRRPRRPSFLSENSDDENDHHRHRKRVNARSREEEEEFERWAAAFNSMCEEVDQHDLEIE